jgi:hypothetical protein
VADDVNTLPSSSASGLARLQEVSVPGTPVARLEPVIGTVRYARLLTAAARFRDRLGQRTV